MEGVFHYYLTTFLLLVFTVLTCIFLRPHLPKWTSSGPQEDPSFAILDRYDSIDCPKNFTLYLLTDGFYIYYVQTRTDSHGERTFVRCELTERSTLPWQRTVPITSVVNESEAEILSESCEDVAYSVKPSIDTNNHKTADDIIMASHLGPEEVVRVEETADGFLSYEIDQTSLLKGIFPGTLWCGFGNIADDIYNRLGPDEEPDRCCRAHDLCKPIIEPFITKYHHRNPSFFPVSHCACDVELYNCFRRINSMVANEIGRLFFNVARMRCFDFEVRELCTERWFGMCWKKELKCAAVLKDNPKY